MNPAKPKRTSTRPQRAAAKSTAPVAATPSEAQRLAAAILEVLAGMRSPPAAAELLAISLPRYYQLEARALEGLVAALAPRPLGKQASWENRVKKLERELEASRRACARQEALVRLTQRSLGLATVAKPQPAAAATPGKRRKPRRPVVRALKAARTLRAKADATAGVSPEASLQPIAPDVGGEENRP